MGWVEIKTARLYLGDCNDVLDKIKADALVTDPPYGIKMSSREKIGKGYNTWTKKSWDNEAPNRALFSKLRTMTLQQIIWGGNYFPLPPHKGYFVWDKGRTFSGRSYGECELAWTNLDTVSRIYRRDPLALKDYNDKSHPTMKPVPLMVWCVEKTEGVVLDPFMGSGSTGVACIHLGRKFIGIERDPEYFETACKRIENAEPCLIPENKAEKLTPTQLGLV